jgi:predicted DNA binding CopG/RHH family protein
MSTLDQEEKEILEAFERGELKSVPNKEAELKRHREYAEATFRKDKRINIRISERDLRALQKRALMGGHPYQTLVSSILRKYVEGRFVEKDT